MTYHDLLGFAIVAIAYLIVGCRIGYIWAEEVRRRKLRCPWEPGECRTCYPENRAASPFILSPGSVANVDHIHWRVTPHGTLIGIQGVAS